MLHGEPRPLPPKREAQDLQGLELTGQSLLEQFLHRSRERLSFLRSLSGRIELAEKELPYAVRQLELAQSEFNKVNAEKTDKSTELEAKRQAEGELSKKIKEAEEEYQKTLEKKDRVRDEVSKELQLTPQEQETYQKLEQETDSLEESRRKTEEKLSQTNTEIGSIGRHKDDLKEKESEASGQERNIQQQLNEAAKQLQPEEQFATLVSEVSTLGQEMEKVVAEISAQAEKLNLTPDKLHEELGAIEGNAQKNIQRLDGQIETVSQQLAQLERELNTSEKHLEGVNNVAHRLSDLRSLIEKYNAISQQLEEARKRQEVTYDLHREMFINSLEQNITHFAPQINQNALSLTEATREYTKYGCPVYEDNIDIEKYQQEFIQWRDKVDQNREDLIQEHRDLIKQKEQMSKARNASSQRLAIAQSAALLIEREDKLKERLDKAKRELGEQASFRRHHDELQSQLQAVQTYRSAVSDELNMIQAKGQVLSVEQKQLNRQLQETNQKITTNNTLIAGFRTRKDISDDYFRVLDIVEKRQAPLIQQLSDISKTKNEISIQRDGIKRQISDLEYELTLLQRQLDRNAASLADHQQTGDRLKSDLASGQRCRDEYRQKLDGIFESTTFSRSLLQSENAKELEEIIAALTPYERDYVLEHMLATMETYSRTRGSEEMIGVALNVLTARDATIGRTALEQNLDLGAITCTAMSDESRLRKSLYSLTVDFAKRWFEGKKQPLPLTEEQLLLEVQEEIPFLTDNLFDAKTLYGSMFVTLNNLRYVREWTKDLHPQKGRPISIETPETWKKAATFNLDSPANFETFKSPKEGGQGRVEFYRRKGEEHSWLPEQFVLKTISPVDFYVDSHLGWDKVALDQVLPPFFNEVLFRQISDPDSRFTPMIRAVGTVSFGKFTPFTGTDPAEYREWFKQQKTYVKPAIIMDYLPIKDKDIGVNYRSLSETSRLVNSALYGYLKEDERNKLFSQAGISQEVVGQDYRQASYLLLARYLRVIRQTIDNSRVSAQRGVISLDVSPLNNTYVSSDLERTTSLDFGVIMPTSQETYRLFHTLGVAKKPEAMMTAFVKTLPNGQPLGEIPLPEEMVAETLAGPLFRDCTRGLFYQYDFEFAPKPLEKGGDTDILLERLPVEVVESLAPLLTGKNISFEEAIKIMGEAIAKLESGTGAELFSIEKNSTLYREYLQGDQIVQSYPTSPLQEVETAVVPDTSRDEVSGKEYIVSAKTKKEAETILDRFLWLHPLDAIPPVDTLATSYILEGASPGEEKPFRREFKTEDLTLPEANEIASNIMGIDRPIGFKEYLSLDQEWFENNQCIWITAESYETDQACKTVVDALTDMLTLHGFDLTAPDSKTGIIYSPRLNKAYVLPQFVSKNFPLSLQKSIGIFCKSYAKSLLA